MKTIHEITDPIIHAMMPHTPRRNIERYWPVVRESLEREGLTAAQWGLMAIATIRAETEAFVPISEMKSKYNTVLKPFDLYNGRTDLGNGPTDGPKYKGRGFIQLTGRDNYTRIGKRIGEEDLVDNPDKANEPVVAARILAAFLKDKQALIERALDAGDLKRARRAVNGGLHGLERFRSAYTTGQRLLGLE